MKLRTLAFTHTLHEFEQKVWKQGWTIQGLTRRLKQVYNLAKLFSQSTRLNRSRVMSFSKGIKMYLQAIRIKSSKSIRSLVLGNQPTVAHDFTKFDWDGLSGAES